MTVHFYIWTFNINILTAVYSSDAKTQLHTDDIQVLSILLFKFIDNVMKLVRVKYTWKISYIFAISLWFDIANKVSG